MGAGGIIIIHHKLREPLITNQGRVKVWHGMAFLTLVGMAVGHWLF